MTCVVCHRFYPFLTRWEDDFVGTVVPTLAFSSLPLLQVFPAASASLGLGASTALAWPFLAAGFSGVWVCRTVWISETVTGIRLYLGSQSMGRSLMVGSRNRMMAGVTLGSSRISLYPWRDEEKSSTLFSRARSTVR